jgi:hypothetical protein
MPFYNWGEAFSQGLQSGMGLAHAYQGAEAQRVLAKDMAKVGTSEGSSVDPKQYSKAMGLQAGGSGPNSQAAVLAAQDASVGGTGARTAAALNSAAPGTATATNDGLTPNVYTTNDAYSDYLKQAAAQGLLTPQQLLQGQQDLTRTQLASTQLGAAKTQAKVAAAEAPVKIDQAKHAQWVTDTTGTLQKVYYNLSTAQTPAQRTAALAPLLQGNGAAYHASTDQNGNYVFTSPSLGQSITVNPNDPSQALNSIQRMIVAVQDPVAGVKLAQADTQLSQGAARLSEQVRHDRAAESTQEQDVAARAKMYDSIAGLRNTQSAAGGYNPRTGSRWSDLTKLVPPPKPGEPGGAPTAQNYSQADSWLLSNDPSYAKLTTAQQKLQAQQGILQQWGYVVPGGGANGGLDINALIQAKRAAQATGGVPGGVNLDTLGSIARGAPAPSAPAPTGWSVGPQSPGAISTPLGTLPAPGQAYPVVGGPLVQPASAPVAPTGSGPFGGVGGTGLAPQGYQFGAPPAPVTSVPAGITTPPAPVASVPQGLTAPGPTPINAQIARVYGPMRTGAQGFYSIPQVEMAWRSGQIDRATAAQLIAGMSMSQAPQ